MPKRPIFYDTETTGISPAKDRIIEIAAFDPVQNRTFCKLVNPGFPIPPDATAIHHITDDMVASAGSFASVGLEFAEFCDEDTILIAHNNDAFDLMFLRAEYDRSNLAMPKWTFVDSLKWARRYRRDLPRHTLQFLREIYGIPSNQAHRALDDVIVLHQVFSYMTDDLSIEEIYALLNVPRKIQHMPFGKYQGQPIKAVPKDYITWLAGSGALDKPDNTELKTLLMARMNEE